MIRAKGGRGASGTADAMRTNAQRSSMRDLLASAQGFHPNGSAEEGAVAGLERWLGQALPADYREFLLAANGGKGMMGSNPVFFGRAEQSPALNEGIAQLAPSFVMIGSDCIGGGYFLDRRTGLRSVVRMELIDLDHRRSGPAGCHVH